MEKFIKNNKGFSLVELLIVMAIIGIIAVVSITLFTNVISNSRKKSDEQQALQIEKAVISYMMQSNDYRLEYLKYDGAVHSMDGLTFRRVDICPAEYHNMYFRRQRKGNISYIESKIFFRSVNLRLCPFLEHL